MESVGRDYLCRLEGGESHIGAVAVAQWRSGRVHADRLLVDGHKEEGLAIRGARELCRASGRSVTCVAGIHFDDLDRRQIDEIVAEAQALIRRAARKLQRSKKQPPSDRLGG